MKDALQRPERERLERAIRTVPDFPKPGILFRDLSPVLGDAALFRELIGLLARSVDDLSPSKIVGLDARGFVFGAALAHHLGLGFVPVRKKGKLPGSTLSHSYDLEYGSAELEMACDSLMPGEKVLLIDDLLATGGTAGAAIHLIRRLGAEPLAALFVIELEGLGGRTALQALGAIEVRSLVTLPA